MLNIRFSGVNRASWQGLFYHHMLQRNIYLAARGYTPLHLALTDRDIDQYVTAVDEFVQVHREALLSH
jgi:glutamate-1-semialdehyde 2,1-aminomutase